MKTTIFSIAACSMFALFSCGGAATDGTGTDSTGTINAPADNMRNDMDSSKAAQGTVDDKTHTFMTETAQAGMTEVETGKIAAERATNPRVKRFAEMMVKDHTAANDDLKAIAGNKSVTLPADLGKHQNHLEDLSKEKGADFDKEYMKMMVDGHEDVVKNFEKQAQDGTDPEVKAFAAQKLPTLRMHLDSAKAIHKSLK